MRKRKVFEIVSTVMTAPVESVGEDSSPDTLSGWTSLNHMNLILALEQEFNIRFTDQQAVEMLSVSSILLALNSILGADKSA